MTLTPAELDQLTLICDNGHTMIPTLMRNSTSGNIAATCSVSGCFKWIQWVPQNTKWLNLWNEQHPITFDQLTAITTQEELWIGAIKSMGEFCYAQADSMGFHDKGNRSPLERAMLVVTELAELAEAARHGTLQSPSEHIPDYTQAAEEWADVLVRVFDHSVDDGVDAETLGRAFVAKLAYNRTRGYRHGGKTI